MSRQRHNQNMLSTTTPSLSKDESLVCTREKDKFLQFARLIMVGCNDLFRELFNYLCPPEMLPGNVNSLVEELPRLNQHERKCLYPSTGRPVTSGDFDISLLFKLLKVIVLEQPDGGWDKLPKKTDHKISDELVRIKYYRDEICHESYNKEISNDLFLELWEYIKGAMIGIAECLPRGSEWWELRIDEFSWAPLTLAEEELAEELNQWYLNDLDVKKLLLESIPEIKSDLKKLLKERPLTGEDKELSEKTSFAGPAQKRPLTEKDKELSEETSAAGPAQRQAEKRTNPLHVAAKKGDIKVIKLVLPYYEIDSLDEYGKTPLMLAAAVGNKAAFQMLMQNHADPYLKCPLGDCLLHFAAEGGNKHILRHLLSLNLDVNQRNDVGVTPLATAAILGKQGAFDLLLENKANEFLISKDGYSVLHFAAFAGIVPIIRKLISRGLDPNLEDRSGSTPLITATQESKSEAVEYLLSIGAR